MKKQTKKKLLLAIFIAAMAVFCSAASLQRTNANETDEPEEPKIVDTAIFKILSTGDLLKLIDIV